ncbi:MAG: O-antigen ligase family protein [Phycisphaerae bacterium]
MWPWRTIMFFTTFWVGCILALVNPIWGAVNYIMIYQASPYATWWGRPVEDIGLRLSMLAIGFTVVGILLGRAHVVRSRPWLTGWECAVLGLLGIAVINTILGVGFSTETTYDFEKLWKMLVFVFVLAHLATTRRNLQLVLWALVIGTLYLGYDAYTAPKWQFVHGRLNHVGGPDFKTTSGLAAHLTAILPLVGVAFVTARSWRWRALAAVAGAFGLNAIIMCRTRSAFIGLVVGTGVALLAAPRVRRHRIRALLIVGACLGTTLTDTNYWLRMETLTKQATYETEPSTVGRLRIWHASLTMIADHPLGVGVGNFAKVIGQYDPEVRRRSCHNTVLLCFAELGVHGGILFLLIVALSLRYIHASVKLAQHSDAPLETKLFGYGLLVSNVTYLVTGLGTERLYCESFWWVLLLPVCLYRAVQAEARAGRNVPQEAWRTAVPVPRFRRGGRALPEHTPVPGGTHP